MYFFAGNYKIYHGEKPAKEEFEQIREILSNFNQNLHKIQTQCWTRVRRRKMQMPSEKQGWLPVISPGSAKQK